MRTRLATLCVAFVVLPLAANSTLSGQEGSAELLDIGSRLELFADDYLIESLVGVNLMLQEPQSAASSYHTVFKDGDLYRMYYRGSSHAGYPIPSLLEPGVEIIPEHTEVACYIESRDGHTWTRPALGLLEFEGSKENNIIWNGQSEGGHNFAPFKDGNPAASASGRYKALGGRPLIAFNSADGIRWKKIREEPVIREVPVDDGAFASLNVPFWDPVRKRYVAIYRHFELGVRTIKCATSTDFINWTPGEWADYGDTPREHLYTNATTPYFRAPHIYLAFPKRFVLWRTFHKNTPGSGVSETAFMTSRDGVHGDRRFMEAFIRPGRDPKNWIHRANMVSAGVVPTAPDEVSFYVTRHYTLPSAHLERMFV